MMLVRLGPAERIAIGLAALTSLLVLLLDLLLGVFPPAGEPERMARVRLANTVSTQLAVLVQQPDPAPLLRRAMEQAVAADGELLSMAVRRIDGSLLAATEGHAHWVPPPGGGSSVTHLMVEVRRQAQPWGQVEMRFAPPAADWRWLQFMAGMWLAGGLLYALFLRRVLHHLDPGAAVPERVKHAFDTLTEAVMIVDRAGRIVMANRAFDGLHPQAAAADRLGKPASGLQWLVQAMPAEPHEHAWHRVMDSREASTGEVLAIPQPDGAPPRRLVLHATPVKDTRGAVRGALVTFDDVTELDRMNTELRAALGALEASRQEIEAKNRELTELATRDPLSGCFNRRALFAAFEPIFARALAARLHGDASGGGLCVVMADIDHFKSFNDRYGHAVGDLVIKAVARALGTTLRPQDILARYGGEEFCILLPGLDIDEARQVADRLRQQIERHAGKHIEGQGTLRITSSFGVASVAGGAASAQALLEQADAALYAAKKAGRNRVECAVLV
ncbi:diguanylate cyclase [Aquincola sp. J276]|uniref:sensor domain-containing diguanylate cyclase n=1 Tax=Aquincola sp. J276 TaxID=2898432 RepID=UPI0021512B8A|nr:diguanylate cyclase [Aquincola sp. J276]MCR5864989.1 diguanylate cyclase [Aquincola sp. J276]